MDRRDRNKQVKESLSGKYLHIDELKKAMECSENYVRKLVYDLMFTGHVIEKKFPGPRGKPKSKFTWDGSKQVPTAAPEQQALPKYFKRTDPLMIALFGEAK